MQMKDIEWLPIVASIGVGAVTYSVMTGKGGQIKSFIPMIANMAQGQGQQDQSQSQSGQNGQSQNYSNMQSQNQLSMSEDQQNFS